MLYVLHRFLTFLGCFIFNWYLSSLAWRYKILLIYYLKYFFHETTIAINFNIWWSENYFSITIFEQMLFSSKEIILKFEEKSCLLLYIFFLSKAAETYNLHIWLTKLNSWKSGFLLDKTSYSVESTKTFWIKTVLTELCLLFHYT